MQTNRKRRGEPVPDAVVAGSGDIAPATHTSSRPRPAKLRLGRLAVASVIAAAASVTAASPAAAGSIGEQTCPAKYTTPCRAKFAVWCLEHGGNVYWATLTPSGDTFSVCVR
jgi:hypothetical protein